MIEEDLAQVLERGHRSEVLVKIDLRGRMMIEGIGNTKKGHQVAIKKMIIRIERTETTAAPDMREEGGQNLNSQDLTDTCTPRKNSSNTNTLAPSTR